MSGLTDSRMKSGRPIFDCYLEILLLTKKLQFRKFENELKAVWRVGYQELKPIMIDLAKQEKYTPLAVRYMEAGDPPGVVAEFKLSLAKAYGIRSYNVQDREVKKREFWERVFAESPITNKPSPPNV